MSEERQALSPEQWRRLNRLLENALTLDDDARRRWLAQLQGESAEVLDMLRELLAQRDDTRQGPLGSGDQLPRRIIESIPAEDQPGDTVGPFRLLRILGRGGMSTVWAAERTDASVQRQVALKIPHAEWSDRALSERLARECRVLAELNHPNIAHLYDAGAAANGRPWLALELVEGQPIDLSCTSLQLDTRARVRLFIDVLKAVAYAHARLVVHRDIKPANVLVNPQGQVKLLDFGIAKMLVSQTGSAEETELTRISGRPLTLAYAAPEQVTGGSITTATDIYSLGAVLYELLCGVRATRPRDDTRAALETAILHGLPALPSSVAQSAEAARALRGDLDAILLKALGRHPETRYATAEAFADDLGRYLDGHGVKARLASRRYRVERFLVRNRLAVGTAAVVTLALVSGLAVALWQAHEASTQARIAATERDRALAALEYRDAVDSFMSDLLQEAGRAGKPVSITELIDRADAMSAKEFVDAPEARASLLKTVAETKVNGEGVEQAIADLEQASHLLENSRDGGLRAGVGCTLALLRGTSGHLGGTAEARRQLLQLAAAAQTPTYERADCLKDLAQLELYEWDGAAARRAGDSALQAWQSSGRKSPRQYVEIQLLSAQARAYQGETDGAESAFRVALQEMQRLGRDRGAWGMWARFGLIECARSSGDPRSALLQVDDVIRLQQADEPGTPTPGGMLEIRALVLSDLGRFDQAAGAFRQLADAARGSDPALRERALMLATEALARSGRDTEAAALFHDATSRQPGDAAATGVATGLSTLGAQAALAIAQHDFAGARLAVREALASPRMKLTKQADLELLAAEAELGAGDGAAARAFADQALVINRRLQGTRAESVRVARAQLVLGRAQLALGNRELARQDFSAAERGFAGGLGDSHAWTRQARGLVQGVAAPNGVSSQSTNVASQ